MAINKNSIAFYLDTLKGFRLQIAGLLLSLLAVGFLSAYPIVFIKKTIDSAVGGQPVETIIYFGSVYFLLHIFNAFFGRWFEYYSNYTSNVISHSLRCRLFDHLQHLRMKYYDSKDKTSFLFGFIEDNSITASSFLQPLAFLGRSVLTFIFGFYYMWDIDRGITLILLPVGLLVTSTVILSGKQIEKRQHALLAAKENLWQIFSEFMHGIKEIKGNRKEPFALGRIRVASDGLKTADIRSYAFQSLTQGVNQFFFMGIIAFIMVYGAVRVKLGLLSIGGLSAIMMYNGLLVDPMIDFFSLYQRMKSQLINIDRIRALFAYETEKDTPGLEFSGVRDTVVFKDLAFAYPETSRNILDGFNLSIKHGEKIALVGKSGQGKTTLAKLLCRFYEPAAGSILIDGRDINEYTPQSLRGKIGVVYQDFFLFKGTILDNLTFGNPGATEKQISEVVRIAGLEGMISRLPNGLRTDIGENGVRISGGEKQRIGIARALLRDVDLLILDEAVANLDSLVTADILENIHGHLQEKTIIFVMHKLTTIINMPRIILLDGGRLAADGKHTELVAGNPLYREMYDRQFSTFEIPGAVKES